MASDDNGVPVFVKMQDSSGNIVSVPKDIADNPGPGLTPLTPEQQQQQIDEAHYNEPAQQALATFEGGTFGLASAFEKLTGLSSSEDIAKRAQYNPGLHLLGQLPSLIALEAGTSGLGTPGILGRIGEAGAEGIGLGADAAATTAAKAAGESTLQGGLEYGLDSSTATKLAGNVAEGARRASLASAPLLSRVGSSAAKLAIENMLVTGGDEVGKMLTSDDPSSLISTAVLKTGLSGVIGAGFGGLGAGVISPLWKATFGRETEATLQNLYNTASGIDPATIGSSVANAGIKTFDTTPTKVTWETIPSTSLNEDINNASPVVKRAFNNEAAKIIQNPQGADELASRLGIEKSSVGTSTGGYNGLSNPNVISGIQTSDPAKLDAYARSLQYIYKQDAVPYFKAIADSPDKNGVIFQLNSPLSEEGEKTFTNALKTHLGPDAGYTKLSPTEIAVINFKGGDGSYMFDPSEFQNNIMELGNSYEKELGINGVDVRGIESNYGPVHDWAKDPKGLDLLASLQAPSARSPDFQSWLDSRRQLFESTLKDWQGRSEEEVTAGAAPSPQDAQERLISSETLKLKPNASDISDAAERLGVKPTVGTLSNSQMIQDMENTMTRSPTIPGQSLAGETTRIRDKLIAGVKTLLADASPDSDAVVGGQAKSIVLKSLEDELAPLEESYEKHTPMLKEMEIPLASRRGASTYLRNMDIVKAAPGDEASELALRLSREIGNLKNAYGIKIYRTSVNSLIEAAKREGNGSKLEVLYAAKGALNTMNETAIKRATELTGIDAKEVGNISQQTIAELKDTNAKYAIYKNRVRQFGAEAGLGTPKTVADLRNRFAKISDESMPGRVFDVNDTNQRAFMKENFPEAYELGRRAKLSDILEKSKSGAQGKNSEIQLQPFLTQTSNKFMHPEARSDLFGSTANLQKLDDIRLLHGAVPGVTNPSGTDVSAGFRSLFSPEGLIHNLTDGIKYAALKGAKAMSEGVGVSGKSTGLGILKAMQSGADPHAAGFKAMADLIESASKGESILTKAAKAVFNAGEKVVPELLYPSDKDKEQLDKKLRVLQTEPHQLLNVGGETSYYMPEHAQAIGQLSANAVNYLNSLRPMPSRPSPLDEDIAPTPMAKSLYDGALSIAESPVQVLEKVKDGTINMHDLQHLQSLYPTLYKRMGEKVMNNLIETVHSGERIPYHTKMGLSLFLGQPLDSTMTPQGIMSAQPVVAAPMESQGGSSRTQGRSHSGSLKNITNIAKDEQTVSQSRVLSRQSQT